MYLDFFGFTEEPFNITPNSRFLFLSQRHREALAALTYGIDQRKGFIALTGEIGCGKTTICRAMLGRLDRQRNRLAVVLNPELSDLELLQTINAEFGVPATSTSKRELLADLNRFLLDEYRDDRNVVLLIDEAQRLSPQALEQVRLISNLETETAKLIQIALVGQPELADMLDLPELEQLNQRITVRFHISPLSFEEMSEYIAHRLEVAGARKPIRFHKKALRRVFEYSGGVPRRVNVLCDRALLVAFVREQTEVSEEVIEKAIGELGGMPRRRAGKPVVEEVEDPKSPPPAAPAARSEEGARSQPIWPLAAALFGGLLLVAVALAFQRPAPSSTPVVIAAPVATPAPTPVASPVATPVATVAPTPSPAPSPVPSPTPAPSPTPEPSPTPAPSPSPSPAPSPSPSPTPAPTPEPTPQPTPTPTPVPAWTYDADGVLRVSDQAVTYHASVITWLAQKRGSRFPEDQLAILRSMSLPELMNQRLATGRAPLFLSEVHLAPSLTLLTNDMLPVLIQSDDTSPGFGPWSVVVAREAGFVTLLDPRAGRIRLATQDVEDHLTAVVAPFFDPESILGLKPLDEGERVLALQRRLARIGLYAVEPSGTFDPITELAVSTFRQRNGLPAGNDVDRATAFRLLAASEEK